MAFRIRKEVIMRLRPAWRTRLLGSFAVILYGLPYQASAVDASTLFQQVKPYVVRVVATDSGRPDKLGSGVTVGVNEILTNCHVIEGASDLSIEFSDGGKSAALPGGRAGNLDLCILSVRTGTRKFPKVAPMSSVRVGQPVFALGNPLSLTESFSDGLISGIRKQEGQTVIHTTAPISPGSSGGGLFDSTGRLVGITTFTLVRGQNINFALPAEYMTLARSSSPEPQQGAKVQNLTFKAVSATSVL
jgi:S1-C subfamily serine protease